MRLLERGAARLRCALTEEHAVRHAAVAAAKTTTPSDVAATVVAARKALALKKAGSTQPSASLARLTRRLTGEAGFTSLRLHPAGEIKRPAIPGQPRRPRPP